jgi:hypothetical protein
VMAQPVQTQRFAVRHDGLRPPAMPHLPSPAVDEPVTETVEVALSTRAHALDLEGRFRLYADAGSVVAPPTRAIPMAR